MRRSLIIAVSLVALFLARPAESAAAAGCDGGVCCCQIGDLTCQGGPCDTYGTPGNCGSPTSCQPGCPVGFQQSGTDTCGCHPWSNNCATTACGSVCTDDCGGTNYGTYCPSGQYCPGQYSGATCTSGSCTPGGCDTAGCADACTGAACGWDGCGTCATGTKDCTTPTPGPSPTPTPAPPTAPTSLTCRVPNWQPLNDFSFTGNWTRGTGGDTTNSQRLRMDDNTGSASAPDISDVWGGCAGQADNTDIQSEVGPTPTPSTCISKYTLGNTVQSHTFPSYLRSGDRYFWRVANVRSSPFAYADATAVCRTCPVKTFPTFNTPACTSRKPTEFTVGWTPSQQGTGNFTKQVVRVDQNENDVTSGCVDGTSSGDIATQDDKCTYKGDLTTTPQSTTATSLTAGRTYYVRVAGVNDASGTDNPFCYKDAITTCNSLNTGTIKARAVLVSNPDCTETWASTTGLDGTVTHQFLSYPSGSPNPGTRTQTDSDYVSFSNLWEGTYTLNPSPPVGYELVVPCWSKDKSGTPGTGLTESLAFTGPTKQGETLTWDIGYVRSSPWVQTKGGSVYAAGLVTSYVGPLSSPRQFILDADLEAGGYPGAVLYATDYDFDATVGVLGKGEQFVSSKGWLASQQEEQATITDWYMYYYIKLGGKFDPANGRDFCGASEYNFTTACKPLSKVEPYYIDGDMGVGGGGGLGWQVEDGETIIIIVNGSLTINEPVRMAGSGTGFVAFIVKGNITVSSSVGSLSTDSTPDIEGLYITSPTGSFLTGTSTSGDTARLVAKGVFTAGSFTLQRDLKNYGGNAGNAAELFIYDPGLLFRLPYSMLHVPIVWREAPP